MSQMELKLIIDIGPGKGSQYIITDISKLGRSPDNNIHLEDEMVSNNHAEIKKIADSFYLVDLGSQNGTRVNGHLVTRELPLYQGDKIEIGNRILRVELLKKGQAINRPSVDTRFNKVRTKKKRFKSLYVIAGFALLFIGRFIFFSATENGRGNIDLYWYAANNYYKRGLYNDALVELEVALAVQPRNQDVIKLIEDTREKVRTEKSFEAAVALCRSENTRELEEAIDGFNKVLKLEPNHKEALTLKAETEKRLQSSKLLREAKHALSKGRYNESNKKVNLVLEQFPNNKLALNYSELIRRHTRLRRESEQARAKAKAAKSRVENKPPQITRLIVEQSSLAVGEKTYVTVVAFDPNNDVLSYEWSAKYGSIEGLNEEVKYVTPDEVPESKSEEVTVSVRDESGSVASQTIIITIKPSKPKVMLTEEQKTEAKKLFIEGYRLEKEFIIRDIPKAMSFYKKVLEIAPDLDYIYYQKAASRLSQLQRQDKG